MTLPLIYSLTSPHARAAIVAWLEQEQYREDELSGDGSGGDYERGHRKGFNDSRRDLIAALSQDHMEVALAAIAAADAEVTTPRQLFDLSEVEP